MTDWIVLDEIKNEDTGITEVTSALGLPAGCLISRTVRRDSVLPGKNTIATALAFVPNLTVKRIGDMTEFGHKL